MGNESGNTISNTTPGKDTKSCNNPISSLPVGKNDKVLKNSKKKLAVFMENEVSNIPIVNDELEKIVDQLYEEFQNTANKVTYPKNLNLDPRISNDLALNKLVNDYQQTQGECEELIAYTKQRMAVCRVHQGYLPDLSRLLDNSKHSLITLHTKLDRLLILIKERTQLISPPEINDKLILNAKLELMATLDHFMLNFCLIKLDDKSKPNTEFLIEQLSSYIKTIIEGLRHKDLRLSKSSIDTLDAHLRNHLGLQTTLERLFSTTEINPINEANAEQLIKSLFQNIIPASSENDVRNELASIYDLISKIKVIPIVKIKNYETLVGCEKNQHEVLVNLHSDLKVFLQQMIQMLQSELSLFSSSNYGNYSEIKKAHLLLQQYQMDENALTQMMEGYVKKRELLKNTVSPLQRLSDITALQQVTLNSLNTLKNQNQDKRISTQETALLVENLYRTERHSMVRKYADALNQAQLAVKEQQALNPYKEQLLKAEDTLNFLKNYDQKPNLASLQSRFQTDIATLKECLQEVKEGLKISYAKHIVNLIPMNGTVRVYSNYSLFQIICNLKEVYVPYGTPSLNSINPFKTPLTEQAKTLNEEVEQLFNRYSKLQHTAGDQLGVWKKSVSSQLDRIQELSDEHLDLEEQAEIIEKRLITKAYKTSIRVIQTLNDEILRILRSHIDLAQQKDPENSQLKFLKENPDFYLNQSTINKESAIILNQVDSRLIKLFNIRVDFQELNNKYINQDTTLCNDEKYINKLFKITQNHLQNNTMENLSKDVGRRGSSFVYWLRIHVLKPIAQCHYVAKDYINPYFSFIYHLGRTNSQTTHPKFFTPTCKTPLASRTENELIRTGKEALNVLETEYQTTLVAAAV